MNSQASSIKTLIESARDKQEAIILDVELRGGYGTGIHHAARAKVDFANELLEQLFGIENDEQRKVEN